MSDPETEIRAEIRLPTSELRDDLPFFTKTLGMRLDMIYPADDPQVAVFSGHGVRLRIEKGASEPAGTLRLWAVEHGGVASGEDGLVDRARRRFRLAADATADRRALRTRWLWGAEVLVAFARDSLGQEALGALSPEEVGERVDN